MKTWEEYKEWVSSLSPELKADVEEAALMASLYTEILAVSEDKN